MAWMQLSQDDLVSVRRWAGFVCAGWLMAFSGVYGFPNYSGALKKVMGLSQTQLNALSIAKDVGDAVFGVLVGLLSNCLPAWAQLCISACVGLLGYGAQWLVVSQIITTPLPYWMIFMAAMVAGNAVAWINTAIFTSSVKVFPHNRGPVVGLLKAYMGLSAAIFAMLCSNLFSSSPSMYLVLQTFVPPMFCIVAAMIISPDVPPAHSEDEKREEKNSLFYFNWTACYLAVYIIIIYIFLPSHALTRFISVGIFFVILVAPAFVPVFILFRIKTRAQPPSLQEQGEPQKLPGEYPHGHLIEDNVESRQQRPAAARESRVSCNNLHGGAPPTDCKPAPNSRYSQDVERISLQQPLIDSGIDNEDTRCFNIPAGCCGSLPELGEDRSILVLLRSWDFYVFYFSLFCGAGAGITFSNNLGQIGQSFGFDNINIFTSFFSLGNFFGRIVSGIVSEHFLRVAGMPRPAWMGISKLPMVAVFIWLSTGSHASLYVGSLVLGFFHGSLVTLTLPILSELYGLKHFSINFMVTNTHIVAGSSVFSSIVAGFLYDEQAKKQAGKKIWWVSALMSGGEGSLTCYGSSCYGATFAILAGLLGATIMLDAILTFISRTLYRKLQFLNAHHIDDNAHQAYQHS